MSRCRCGCRFYCGAAFAVLVVRKSIIRRSRNGWSIRSRSKIELGVGIGLDVGSKVGVAVGRGGVLAVVFGEVELVVIAVSTAVETGRNKQVSKDD